MARDERIADLVDRLELGFNSLGIDPYGIEMGIRFLKRQLG